MQPYQKATEEIRRQAQAPKKALGTVGAVVGATAGGSALASRVLPLLSQYIPGELMRKGLSKVSPRIGSFVDTAINNGYGLDDIREYMKEKFSLAETPESPQQTNDESKTEIQNKHDPLQDFENNYTDIAQALANTMKQGQSPQAAAGILKNSTAFGKQIKKFEKDTGKNFVDYILELFGPNAGSMQQPQGMQQQQEPQQPQSQQMSNQGNAQGSGFDQQIIAALDKILKM